MATGEGGNHLFAIQEIKKEVMRHIHKRDEDEDVWSAAAASGFVVT